MYTYADKNSAYIYEDYIEITETDVTVIDEKVSLREAAQAKTQESLTDSTKAML